MLTAVGLCQRVLWVQAALDAERLARLLDLRLLGLWSKVFFVKMLQSVETTLSGVIEDPRSRVRLRPATLDAETIIVWHYWPVRFRR